MNQFYIKKLGNKWLLHGKGQRTTYTLGLFNAKKDAVAFAFEVAKDYDLNKWERIEVYRD